MVFITLWKPSVSGRVPVFFAWLLGRPRTRNWVPCPFFWWLFLSFSFLSRLRLFLVVSPPVLCRGPPFLRFRFAFSLSASSVGVGCFCLPSESFIDPVGPQLVSFRKFWALVWFFSLSWVFLCRVLSVREFLTAVFDVCARAGVFLAGPSLAPNDGSSGSMRIPEISKFFIWVGMCMRQTCKKHISWTNPGDLFREQWITSSRFSIANFGSGPT